MGGGGRAEPEAGNIYIYIMKFYWKLLPLAGGFCASDLDVNIACPSYFL